MNGHATKTCQTQTADCTAQQSSPWLNTNLIKPMEYEFFEIFTDALPTVTSFLHGDTVTDSAMVSSRIPNKFQSPEGYRGLKTRSSLEMLVVARKNLLLLYDAQYNKLLLEYEGDFQFTRIRGYLDRIVACSADGSVFLLRVTVGGEPVSAPEHLGSSSDTNTRESYTSKYELVVKMSVDIHITPFSTYPRILKKENVEFLDGGSMAPGEVEDSSTSQHTTHRQDTDSIHIAAVDTLLTLKGQTTTLVVGYSNGILRTFVNRQLKAETAFDGSLVAMAVFGEPVHAMLLTSTGLGQTRLLRPAPFALFCSCEQLNTSALASLAYDLQSPTVMYVATSDGRVLLFHTRNMHSKVKQQYCTPKFSWDVEADVPLHLAVIKGYLLVVSPTTLYVYNTTQKGREVPSFLMHRRLRQDRPVPRDSPSFLISVTSSSSQYLTEDLIAVTETETGKIVIYRSLLTLPPESGKSWLLQLGKIPFFLVGVVIVALVQMCKKKTAKGRLRTLYSPSFFHSSPVDHATTSSAF